MDDVPGYLGRVLDREGGPVGTCFQVAPRVIATAWHVLRDAGAGAEGDDVSIEPLGGGRALRGRVTRIDALRDIAVMILDAALQASVVGLVRAAAVRRPTELVITGVSKVPDTRPYRLTHGVGRWLGVAYRSDGVARGQAEVVGTARGMSGAPVRRVGDDRVVGVLAERLKPRDEFLEHTVWLVCIDDLLVLLPAGLDVDVTDDVFGEVIVKQVRYVLEDFQLETPPRASELPPSSLLAARYRFVDFDDGRSPELRRLAEWRDHPSTGMAVKLVHGPGGQGKTRLAAEFAAQTKSMGWRVVVARELAATMPLSPFPVPLRADERGLLIIVDYAERWLQGHLAGMIVQLWPSGRAPVRVLLLARPGGPWWEEDRPALRAKGIGVSELRLGPLTDRVDPQALFDRAVTAFAKVLDVPDVGSLRIPLMSGDDQQLVLTLHMAALLAVYSYANERQSSPESAGGDNNVSERLRVIKPEELSAELLDREMAYWRALHVAGRISISVRQMSRAVYAATLLGPTRYVNAVAALRRGEIDDSEKVVDDHLICYPARSDWDALEPLYPDRLGEDFIALSTPGHSVQSIQADPWTSGFIDRLLASANTDAATSTYARSAITVLVETAHRWQHIADQHLSPLLLSHPELAVAAGNATMIRLASIENVDIAVLRAVRSRLPSDRHVELDPAIAAITVRLTAYTLERTRSDEARAQSYIHMAYVLGNAGRHQESLEATESAVKIWRRLDMSEPGIHAVDLASALDNLGVCLSLLGRMDESLAVGLEAITLYRRCIKLRLPNLERALANALTGVSVRFQKSDLDRARAAAEEAVKLRLEIVDAAAVLTGSPDGALRDHDLADLARASHNLADVLTRQDLHAPALRHSRKDVKIFSGLMQADPAHWKPDYARALWMLCRVLSGLDVGAEIQAIAIETVRAYGQLATANPTAHSADAIMALAELSNLLAPEKLQEAASTIGSDPLRHIAVRVPEWLHASLAFSLLDYNKKLLGQGLYESALVTTGQVVEILTTLHASDASVFAGPLVAALRFHHAALQAMGAQADAELFIDQALEVYDSHSDDEIPVMAFHFAVMLDAHGDVVRAETAYRRTIQSGHHELAPKAAYSLGDMLTRNGDPTAALGAYQCAIDFRHRDWEPMAELRIGLMLSKQSDDTAARPHYERAITSGHRVAAQAAQFTLGNLLYRQGDWEGAESAYRTAFDLDDSGFKAMAGANLAELLAERGRDVEATHIYQTVVDLQDAEVSPSAALELGKLLEKQGHTREASAMLQQAADAGDAAVIAEASLMLQRLILDP